MNSPMAVIRMWHIFDVGAECLNLATLAIQVFKLSTENHLLLNTCKPYETFSYVNQTKSPKYTSDEQPLNVLSSKWISQ